VRRVELSFGRNIRPAIGATDTEIPALSRQPSFRPAQCQGDELRWNFRPTCLRFGSLTLLWWHCPDRVVPEARTSSTPTNTIAASRNPSLPASGFTQRETSRLRGSPVIWEIQNQRLPFLFQSHPSSAWTRWREGSETGFAPRICGNTVASFPSPEDVHRLLPSS
jgi:hypothetical protein